MEGGEGEAYSMRWSGLGEGGTVAGWTKSFLKFFEESLVGGEQKFNVGTWGHGTEIAKFIHNCKHSNQPNVTKWKPLKY